MRPSKRVERSVKVKEAELLEKEREKLDKGSSNFKLAVNCRKIERSMAWESQKK
uniref:Uncharacterized protein n=1 Tax=Rhizophora mucronata TaxID=61149 RepID=A0A2P2PEJ5_RHIMU